MQIIYLKCHKINITHTQSQSLSLSYKHEVIRIGTLYGKDTPVDQEMDSYVKRNIFIDILMHTNVCRFAKLLAYNSKCSLLVSTLLYLTTLYGVD